LREQKQEPEYTNQARKFLRGLDELTERRIIDGIEKIPEGDITPYKSMPKFSRLRIGDFRIIYRWKNAEQILVFKIGSRGQIY